MTAASPSALDARLSSIAERFSGDLSVAARHLTTSEVVTLEADRLMPTASVIKVPILVALLRAVETGAVHLGTRVEMRATDRRGGSGILAALEAGLAPTVRDLATLMVVLSDNTATNMVLDQIGGVGPVNAEMDALGLPGIRLHNRIDFEVIGSDVRRLGEASARDISTLFHLIAMGGAVSREASRAMEEILGSQQYLDQAIRYVQVMPYWRDLGQTPMIITATKTGFFPGTRVDSGIVRFSQGGGFTFCVMNHGSSDETFVAESEGAVINGLVGKALLEHWWPADAGPVPVLESAYDDPRVS
jgi:beta-lactamase class A